LDSGCNGWLAPILRRPQFGLRPRSLHLLLLRSDQANAPFARRHFLLRRCTRRYATVPAVIADSRNVYVIHHRRVVNVADLGYVHVVHGTGVIEAFPPPAPAVISVSGITVAVINATIETDPRSPVPLVKDERHTIPSPV